MEKKKKKHMTICNWWNIKWNIKNDAEDLYYAQIQILCTIFCVSLYIPPITTCHVFV